MAKFRQKKTTSDLERHIARSMLGYCLGMVGDSRSEEIRARVARMTDAELREEAQALADHPKVGHGAVLALHAIDGR